MKKYLISIASVTLMILNVSCNDYLDEIPDNRLELDTDEKITRLLGSGYANHLFVFTTEMMSDNVDDRGNLQTSYSILQDEMYAWKDIQEIGNESPKRIWETYYLAIATANEALDAIEKAGNPERLNPQRGEALMIRAFHHFYLVNVFAKHYSTAGGETDLGIVYMEEPETTVKPAYKREPVAEIYRKIERDIAEALPMIDDNIYEVPKYHFNRRAAYAFAARFYLFYRKYDKVIACANEVLGENPTRVLRDLTRISSLVREFAPIAEDYVKPEQNANLLLMTGYSQLGRIFGNYSVGKKYMHSKYLAGTETTQCNGPWGTYVEGMFYLPSLSYTAGYIAVPKLPNLFEYTDPVAGIGYRRTVYSALHTDETLLCRAEAYIMQENYDAATEDLALWMSQHTTSSTALTRELVNNYYSAQPYYKPDDPTPKKQLNPEIPVVSEEQENFLQCLVQFRRIETIFEGLRWFDIKRFGIVIYRRYLDENNTVTVTDELKLDDQRRAIQLPASVISAGMEPNPR
ncbi:MAG: RagB/SusD family nutrient uptake outer membrane protein [Prevotellaceae bacterium]|jgi:tetratricopeptide (TPR) repeat protein|nr:RagB/SusD family nutrient uptake outer membrane protein [Prevotellaceae bacterium]